MRTGKNSVSASTIVLPIQFFGMDQRVYLPDILPIGMVDSVVTRRPGRERIVVGTTIFF